jgi:hypothetical protein
MSNSKAWRPIWIMALMSLLCMGAVVGALGAFAQEKPEAQQQTSPRAEPKEPVLDDAQTIADDPIIAPDAAESADNNISFPVDI